MIFIDPPPSVLTRSCLLPQAQRRWHSRSHRPWPLPRADLASPFYRLKVPASQGSPHGFSCPLEDPAQGAGELALEFGTAGASHLGNLETNSLTFDKSGNGQGYVCGKSRGGRKKKILECINL